LAGHHRFIVAKPFQIPRSETGRNKNRPEISPRPWFSAGCWRFTGDSERRSC